MRSNAHVCLFAACLLVAVAFTTVAGDAAAQTTKPSQPAAAEAAWPTRIERVLPPVAKPLPAKERAALMARLRRLEEQFEALPEETFAGPRHADVGILTKAVGYALLHEEFFDHKKDLARADAVLTLAEERLKLLADGKDPTRGKKGVVVRGYYSEIDGSCQPYALIIPEDLDLTKPAPLYIWLHGRGDTQCDLQFIANFLTGKAPGQLQPKNAIVLHPFGRYCNGFKGAGEHDVVEALRDVRFRNRIDSDRIVLAGFSMGGAGAWHMGAHLANWWCAVHAGAGFVDVKRYQNITDDNMPPWYVQKLWGLNDVPAYRRNLLNVPVIAYSGELDKQKAAADIMEAELAEEGMKLTHLIGPGMGHKYHPDVLADVQKRLAGYVEEGRRQVPAKVTMQTRTMRYPQMFWIRLMGMEEQWRDTRIDGERDGVKSLKLSTTNVRSLCVTAGDVEWDKERFAGEVEVTLDGQALTVKLSEPTAVLGFERRDGKWSYVPWETLKVRYMHLPKVAPGSPLRKSEDVCGPIDDAFTKTFVVCRPYEHDADSLVDRWTRFEAEHAVMRWRMLMRGDPYEARHGQELLDDMNWVLWGTPKSNPRIAEILDKLPLKWTDKTVGMGDLEFDATKVVPVMIYPNPVNPGRYVVLNSGLTFREAHDRTNSQQNPKLPDWAFVDVTQPPTAEWPGKVLAAGFFDDDWKYQKQPPADAK